MVRAERFGELRGLPVAHPARDLADGDGGLGEQFGRALGAELTPHGVSVTTAYASFQASLYDGETAKQFTAGQNSQTEAESLYLEANQQYIRDVQLFPRTVGSIR